MTNQSNLERKISNREADRPACTMRNRRPPTGEGNSRHHVIPIGEMTKFYDIGCDIMRGNKNGPIEIFELLFLIASGGPNSSKHSSEDKVAFIGTSGGAPLRNAFAWSPINLFAGPGPEFRPNDPGSDYESIKPVSMSEKRWDVLKSVKEFMETIDLIKVNPETGRKHIDKKLIAAYVVLLRRLYHFTYSGEGRILAFKASDWEMKGKTRRGKNKNRRTEYRLKSS
ncbi:hypothetical protein ACJJIQ_04780 [Microbulbifer sp. ANSA003]|uniref:hypothetical protein n=1 Tax=Microbulbifer sp. ANSA003 TaxID=3243360 RepID=UPI0040426398